METRIRRERGKGRGGEEFGVGGLPGLGSQIGEWEVGRYQMVGYGKVIS